jgi:hypothetical protein
MMAEHVSNFYEERHQESALRHQFVSSLLNQRPFGPKPNALPTALQLEKPCRRERGFLGPGDYFLPAPFCSFFSLLSAPRTCALFSERNPSGF